MRDLFDDFLEELRRREAQARGETPPPKRIRRRRAERPRPPRVRRHGRRCRYRRRGARTRTPTSGDDAHGSGQPEPEPLFRAGRGRGRGGRRPPGGPNDGARGPNRHIGLWIAVGVIVGLFLLFTFGIDLWTDAIWFKSVGFDGVFWTRIAAQVGLFVAGLGIALIVFLGNLWLAGRLGPPAAEGGTGLRSFIGRLNDAAQASADARRGYRGRYTGNERTIVFEAEDLPDLMPLAGLALGIVAVLLAVTIAGSLASAWETVLLWVNRVPFSPDGQGVVTDPVFGKDIGFFLFELPFLRLVQGLFNAIVIVALILVLVRYLAAASRGGLDFATPARVHLAVLGGLFLLSVAFGYQLDKYDLVYSTRGVATGVSFTDQNAQFFAYDLLTVISGIAAALLVGAAFTRMLWPLGLTIAVWFVASLVVGRVYPELIQQFTVNPNQYAQEERYISNNIAMTQLAYGIGHWDVTTVPGRPGPHPGPDRGRRGHLPQRATVGLPPARGHARPAPDRADLLRLHGRRHRSLRHRRRPAPGHAQRPGAVARPGAQRGQLGQPADHLHARLRRRDGARQRGRQRGPAQPVHRGHAAGLGRWRSAGDPAADLLRRTGERLHRRRGEAGRVRLPDRRERRRLHGPVHALVRDDRRHPHRHDPRAGCCSPCDSATSTCSSATRSPGAASSCSTAPWPIASSGSRRSCATTRTRTSSSTAPAGWSTSRTPTRPATASRTRRRSTRAPCRARHSAAPTSTTSATASRSRWTRTTGRCTSTSPIPTDPLIRAYRGHVPEAVLPAVGDAGRPRPAPARPRGTVQRPDADVRPVPRDRHPAVLPQRRPLERADGADRASRPCRPRPTTS